MSDYENKKHELVTLANTLLQLTADAMDEINNKINTERHWYNNDFAMTSADLTKIINYFDSVIKKEPSEKCYLEAQSVYDRIDRAFRSNVLYHNRAKNNRCNSASDCRQQIFEQFDKFKVLGENFRLLDEESKVLLEEATVLDEEFTLLDEEFTLLGEESTVLDEESKVLREESKVLREEATVLREEARQSILIKIINYISITCSKISDIIKCVYRKIVNFMFTVDTKNKIIPIDVCSHNKESSTMMLATTTTNEITPIAFSSHNAEKPTMIRATTDTNAIVDIDVFPSKKQMLTIVHAKKFYPLVKEKEAVVKIAGTLVLFNEFTKDILQYSGNQQLTQNLSNNYL